MKPARSCLAPGLGEQEEPETSPVDLAPTLLLIRCVCLDVSLN